MRLTIFLILMITVKTNITEALAPIAEQVASLSPGGALYDTTLRTVATSMLGVVRTRIHQEGKAADGSDIGQYVEGPYKKNREKRGRRTDKVNLSFSGQMDSQLSMIATSNGGYGLGWPNDEMFKRSQGLEQKYNKKIWALSADEEQQAAAVAQNVIDSALSQ